MARQNVYRAHIFFQYYFTVCFYVYITLWLSEKKARAIKSAAAIFINDAMRDVVGEVKAKANRTRVKISRAMRKGEIKKKKKRVRRNKNILRDLPFIVILFTAITVECNFVAILKMG